MIGVDNRLGAAEQLQNQGAIVLDRGPESTRNDPSVLPSVEDAKPSGGVDFADDAYRPKGIEIKVLPPMFPVRKRVLHGREAGRHPRRPGRRRGHVVPRAGWKQRRMDARGDYSALPVGCPPAIKVPDPSTARSNRRGEAPRIITCLVLPLPWYRWCGGQQNAMWAKLPSAGGECHAPMGSASA